MDYMGDRIFILCTTDVEESLCWIVDCKKHDENDHLFRSEAVTIGFGIFGVDAMAFRLLTTTRSAYGNSTHGQYSILLWRGVTEVDDVGFSFLFLFVGTSLRDVRRQSRHHGIILRGTFVGIIQCQQQNHFFFIFRAPSHYILHQIAEIHLNSNGPVMTNDEGIPFVKSLGRTWRAQAPSVNC